MQKRNIRVTVECFVRKNGKYLMLQRSMEKKMLPGVWPAPGGHREHSEGLFECAKREVLEETGLKIKNIQIRATGVGYLKDLDTEVYFHHLVADYKSGKVHQKPTDGRLMWLRPSKILKLDNLLSELVHVLPHIFGRKKGTISYKAIYKKGNQMSKFVLEK